MKILFVSAVLPYPLHSGGQIRIYNLLKRLAKKHEIHLFAFIRSEKEKEYLLELSFCKTVTTVMRGRVWQPKYILKALTSPYSLLWSSYDNSQMRALLAKENYDLVHIEPGYVFPALPSLNKPLVVSEHNIEHEVYQKYAASMPTFIQPFLKRDVNKMKTWEKISWTKASAITVVSEQDKEKIGNAQVVSNGVDIEEFAFRPKKIDPMRLRFLYVGNFRWMENKDAAENIIKNYWPVIKKNYSNATLRIVGQGAPNGPFKSIQEELSKTDILLAPIRIGGGTKFKILEAMAAGVPVITTSLGAAGLDKTVLWIADTPSELDISAVLTDKTKIKKARELIEHVYNWDIIAQRLDTIWNSLS